MPTLTLAAMMPPTDLTVSEWAEQFRILSDEDSAESGPWRNARTPYLAGIMDAWNDPDVEDIVFKKSAQVGATQALNNMIGYSIASDPGPMLVIQPNLDMAKTFTTDRFDTMARDTPELAERVAEKKEKTTSNTTFHKTFPGGHMTVVGANSSAGLKSRPIRYLIGDEVDEYPVETGRTGDPVRKAEKRTATFRGRRKRAYASTPTIDEQSRICAMYESSDQRRYFVPCPDCGEFQTLQHDNLIWPEGDPFQAQYCCEECGTLIDERHKADMLNKGEWRATSEDGRRGVAGFAINELYSPFVSWGEYAEAFVLAAKLPETLQTFVNESMGEAWVEAGTKLEASTFDDRLEDYDGTTLPAAVLLVTLTVDVQDDRIECYAKGWGVDAEGWGLAHDVVEGDPGESTTWQSLDDIRAVSWRTEDGRELRAAITLIDYGGHYSEEVAAYCHRARGRVVAIRGKGGHGPTLDGFSRRNRYRVKVWNIGVNSIKSKLFKRLGIGKHGPGFQHYNHQFTPEWFEQLTSERRKKRRVGSLNVVDWVKRTESARNEAWDLEVYAIAAIEILKPKWAVLQRRAAGFVDNSAEFDEKPEENDKKPAETTSIARQMRRKRAPKRPTGRGFAGAWRP